MIEIKLAKGGLGSEVGRLQRTAGSPPFYFMLGYGCALTVLYASKISRNQLLPSRSLSQWQTLRGLIYVKSTADNLGSERWPTVILRADSEMLADEGEIIFLSCM